MVLSRKYLLAMVTVLICLILAYWNISSDSEEPQIFISKTWPDYIDDCGSE